MNPLKTNELSATVGVMGDINDRVRERIRVEKERRKLSERDIAGMLQWTQSRVSQKLAGRTPITLDELGALCFAVGIAPTEAVRDHGFEFVANMTPTELRIHERIRDLTADKRDALLTILGVVQDDKRRAIPPKLRRRG